LKNLRKIQKVVKRNSVEALLSYGVPIAEGTHHLTQTQVKFTVSTSTVELEDGVAKLFTSLKLLNFVITTEKTKKS
jgi:hypothetical protein